MEGYDNTFQGLNEPLMFHLLHDFKVGAQDLLEVRKDEGLQSRDLEGLTKGDS